MQPSVTPVRRTGKPQSGTGAADYGALLASVRDAGLLRRSYGFYAVLTLSLLVAFAATLTGLALAGNTWAQLPVAIALGIILTQFAFLGHEASHRQVFASKRANDVFGRVLAALVAGISYSWWMNKHTRHHANPNRIDHDPDIEPDTIVFQPRHATGKRRLYAWFLRHQGTLFFPMLLLEGINLHVQGLRYLLDRRNKVEKRTLELTLLLVRLLALPALAFASMPPLTAVLVLVVQLAVFGLYMGASFAPNHKGMPQVPAHLKLSFVHKQVLTSRNITSPGATALFGGLNYQVEHHLFPNMPRPHLARAAKIVQDYCKQLRIPYTATTITESYRIVITYLNSVGRSDRNLFECPMVAAHGRL